MGVLVSDMIKMAITQLEEVGIENAKGEAEQIYCFLKNYNRTQFFCAWSKEASDIEMENYLNLVGERRKRRPLQHILGSTEFMGYPFVVKENVLIPRIDTEVVVLEALKYVSNKDSVLDLCCGSGIIGISMVKCAAEKGINLKLTSLDVSDDAVALTKQNAQKNQVKADVLKGDLFVPVKRKKYNMIVSNPPYIRSDVIPTLETEVKDYDPLLALDGGEDGLVFYRRIVEEAPNHLKKNGYLVFEIGHDQGMEVAQLMKASEKFENIEISKDLAGNDRIVKGQLKGKK